MTLRERERESVGVVRRRKLMIYLINSLHIYTIIKRGIGCDTNLKT